MVSQSGVLDFQHMHSKNGIDDADLQALSFHDWSLFDVQFQRLVYPIEIHRQSLCKSFGVPAAAFFEMILERPSFIVDKLRQIALCIFACEEFAAGHGRTETGAFFLSIDHQRDVAFGVVVCQGAQHFHAAHDSVDAVEPASALDRVNVGANDRAAFAGAVGRAAIAARCIALAGSAGRAAGAAWRADCNVPDRVGFHGESIFMSNAGQIRSGPSVFIGI